MLGKGPHQCALSYDFMFSLCCGITEAGADLFKDGIKDVHWTVQVHAIIRKAGKELLIVLHLLLIEDVQLDAEVPIVLVLLPVAMAKTRRCEV